MSDPVYSQMIAVPGMKIAYHFQIAEGQMIAYEVAEDRTASLEDLNELLDRMGDAAARQKAKHDLPFARLRLKQNREKLAKAERALHEAIAKQEAHIQQLAQSRRNQNGAQPLPTDINAVTQAQHDAPGHRRYDPLRRTRDPAPGGDHRRPTAPRRSRSDQPTVFSFSPAAE